MRYHLISFKMAFIFKKAWQVFVKLRRKRESPWIAGENVNWCSHLGKQYEDSSKKIRNRTVICSRYPTSGYLSKIILNNLKRYRPAMFTEWLSHWGVHLQWGRPGFDWGRPGLGRSPRGRHDNTLQYSCIENLTDRRAWQARVHWIVQSQTWLKWQALMFTEALSRYRSNISVHQWLNRKKKIWYKNIQRGGAKILKKEN